MTPLGLQPCRRYATAVHGSEYDHAKGEVRLVPLPTCLGATQEEADRAADRIGRNWERTGRL
jgi:hypothetical protein